MEAKAVSSQIDNKMKSVLDNDNYECDLLMTSNIFFVEKLLYESSFSFRFKGLSLLNKKFFKTNSLYATIDSNDLNKAYPSTLTSTLSLNMIISFPNI